VNCRDLAVITQSARGEFLQRKQDEALKRIAAAEQFARSVRSAPDLIQDKALEKQLHAIALAEEWGLLEDGQL
jgi:uncharacterized protein YciW